MKYFIIFVLIISLLLVGTGGYYDAKEIAHTVSVIAMGIDKGEKMRYRVSFQIESTGTGEGETSQEGESEKGKSGGAKKKSNDVITVEAPTILSAFSRANSINSVDLSIENVKMVILSEDIGKDGLIEPVSELASATDFKNNAYLASAKGKAEDILKNVSPEDEEYISVYYEQIIFRHYQAATRNFLLSETYFSLIEKGGGDFILPLVSQREDDGFEESYKDDANSSLSAGLIPKESKHKVEFLGGAVYSEGRLKGYLNESEMLAASFIMGFFATRDISIEYPENSGEFVIMSLEQQYKSSINVNTEDIPEVKVKIKLNGSYELIPTGSYEVFNRNFSAFLKKEIEELCEAVIEKCMNEYDADIFGIKNAAKRKFFTIKKMEEYNLEEKIKNAVYNTELNLEMRRSGRFTFE